MTNGRFMRVKCECGAEQVVFSHASCVVRCLGCKEPVAHPSGGEAVIHGKIEEVLG